MSQFPWRSGLNGCLNASDGAPMSQLPSLGTRIARHPLFVVTNPDIAGTRYCDDEIQTRGHSPS